MTAVAYRSGIMAADTQITASNSGGEVATSFNFRKIAKGKTTLGGFAGSVKNIPPYLKWIEEHDGDVKFIPDKPISGLLAKKTGRKIELFSVDDGTIWPIGHDYGYEGSATFFLAGAMAMGAEAVEAVELAMKHVPGCGGRVERVSF